MCFLSADTTLQLAENKTGVVKRICYNGFYFCCDSCCFVFCLFCVCIACMACIWFNCLVNNLIISIYYVYILCKVAFIQMTKANACGAVGNASDS